MLEEFPLVLVYNTVLSFQKKLVGGAFGACLALPDVFVSFKSSHFRPFLAEKLTSINRACSTSLFVV